jgi:hypothetical protein
MFIFLGMGGGFLSDNFANCAIFFWDQYRGRAG